jgi:capsule polysaccharide export protein KpsE/RkpR
MGLVLGVTLLLPKLYTATCRILIEPPTGTDIRSALGVSPIYLESLKTYEHFAASDSLFVRALDRFQLRRRFPARPVESLKAGILKVGMVRDTKILEIKVTLPDPKTAQALALYLGEETVKLSRSVDEEGDRELTETIEKQEADAQARLDRSEAAWTGTIAQQPVEGLQQATQSGGELRSSLERQLLRAEADGSESAGTLRKQLAQVERDLAAQEELLARRMAEHDRVSTERSASQEAYSAVEARLNQVRAGLGYRSERLKIIDPGIVPEQPSGPNIPLRVLAALLLGLVVPVVYLTLAFSIRTGR